MKGIIYLLFIAFLFSCNSEVDHAASFKDFCDQLSPIELPLRIDCGLKPSPQGKDLSQFSKFIPKDCEAAGQIKTDSGLILVLFENRKDSTNPVLLSFDENGERLDSIALHQQGCEISTRLEHSAWTSISEELSIKMTDSSRHFSYMSHGTEYIRSLDSVIVKERSVLLGKGGKFKIIERKQDL